MSPPPPSSQAAVAAGRTEEEAAKKVQALLFEIKVGQETGEKELKAALDAIGLAPKKTPEATTVPKEVDLRAAARIGGLMAEIEAQEYGARIVAGVMRTYNVSSKQEEWPVSVLVRPALRLRLTHATLLLTQVQWRAHPHKAHSPL